jgi:hypothetical protein
MKKSKTITLTPFEFISHLRSNEKKLLREVFGFTNNQANHYIWNLNYYCTPEKGTPRNVYNLGLNRPNRRYDPKIIQFFKKDIYGKKKTKLKQKSKY